jgi:uncharacterized protein YuzE
MKITFDPSANAVYVDLETSVASGVGETDVDERGVIIDTDAGGRPRGYEFLSVRERGLPVETLPPHVAESIKWFVESGNLESETSVVTWYV